MDKSGDKFKFVEHSTEIIRQSKNKGTLNFDVFQRFEESDLSMYVLIFDK